MLQVIAKQHTQAFRFVWPYLYDPTKCVFKQKYARTNQTTMCISINGVKLGIPLTAH